MKKGKTYIAFDIDGTIYDSADIVVPAFQEGIRYFTEHLTERKLTVPGHREILSLVGIPAHEIYVRLFPELTEEELQNLNDSCHNSFKNLIMSHNGRLFPGVYDVLARLHGEGYINLTASNGRKGYIEAILEAHEIRPFFHDEILFLSNTIYDKSDIVALYLERLGEDDLLIMVGDRESDRDAAHLNNVPFIGCAYGHAGMDEIEGEPFIVESFHEVPDMIRKIAGESE